MLVVAVLAAAGVCFLVREPQSAVPIAFDSALPPVALLVWEAEDVAKLSGPMSVAEERHASGGRCLEVPLGAGSPPKAPEGSAHYAFNVKEAGRYKPWLRAKWTDSCANSISVALNGGAAEIAGNDGTYGEWHWVSGKPVELKAGEHTLDLLHREDGIQIDQIALAGSEAYFPEGSLAATQGALHVKETLTPPALETSVPVSDQPVPHAVTAQPEPAPVEVARSAKKFLVGIVGCYRDGFEGHLVALGMPYVRLHDDDLEDLASLKDIDLLIASDARPRGGTAAFYKALYAYLKTGRTAIVEIPQEGRWPSEADPDDLLLQREGGDGTFHGGVLVADQSAFFEGAPQRMECNQWAGRRPLPLKTNVKGAAIFGSAGADWGAQQACGALLVRDYGGGRLYYMAMPAAFDAMSRQRKINPYVLNVLKDAAGKERIWPFAKFAYAPQPTGKVRFADDFMRKPGESGGWKALEGKFALTGEQPREDTSFAVRATGPACAVIGHESWTAYRVSAALYGPQATAGVWYAAGQARVELRLVAGSKVELVLRAADGQEQVLTSAPLPQAPNVMREWHRLALFRRGDRTLGFVDGRAVLRSDAAPAPEGRCGLSVAAGEAYFDDVRVIDTALLEEGTDVAPGEEGSVRCMERYGQRCFERHSVYAPQWPLKPDAADPALLHAALPCYAGGTLHLDEAPPVAIAATLEPAAVRMPGGRGPTFDLAFTAPGWKDYHFAGRVTDWYATSGTWRQINRWSCNPLYEWFGGNNAHGDAVLWHRHETVGPVALNVLMAPRADIHGDREVDRDLNVVLHGNGKDLSAGYLFVVSARGNGCRILRGSKELAAAKEPGLPRGHTLHHPWFSVTALAADGKLGLYLDFKLVLEAQDTEPLTQGQAGIWTRNNKISVARATLAVRPAGK